MRDKYIELIKEYIKEKPEYKLTLNELKADVLTVGATQEEFDEAVKQLTGLPNSSRIFPEEEPREYILENTQQNKIGNFAHFSKTHLIVFSLAVILLIAVTGINFNKPGQKEAIVKVPIATQVTVEKVQIPVVYANTKAVDPDKIFSIKSANVTLTITGKPKRVVLGFFPYWMLPKQDKINLSALTAISLFGLEVDGAGNIVASANNEQASGGFAMWRNPELDTFIKRAKNNGLKVYLTFKSFNSSNIDALTKSDTAQKIFIANALYLVNSKNLDGINIDFEYKGIPSDEVRDGFTRLITNLNIELKRQVPKAWLTIDTYLVSGSEKGIFNIPVLAQNLDAFVIMGYDINTPLGEPGPVSAMGGSTNIIGYVQNYLEKVDASKLILAVPYYGYDWPKDPAASDVVKILPYAEIAQESSDTKLSWDEISQTPFFTYKENGVERIVYFDNVRSLAIKYDFINSKNLKGVGLWALGYDGQNQDLEKLLIDKFINQ